MSVVTRLQDGTAHAFLKGSFERVAQLVDPESLPRNYSEIAEVRLTWTPGSRCDSHRHIVLKADRPSLLSSGPEHICVSAGASS